MTTSDVFSYDTIRTRHGGALAGLRPDDLAALEKPGALKQALRTDMPPSAVNRSPDGG